MRGQRDFPWSVFLGLGLALVATLCAAFIIRQAESSRQALPVLGKVPPFQFVTQSGAPFGQQQMLGRVCVVDFIFTRCPGICPVMADRFSQLYKLYGDAADFQLISISVDPENDTLEALSRYASDHGVHNNRWVFLRGPLGDVEKLCEGGFLLPAQDLPLGHSGKFILVDRQGRIRGYYDHDSDADQALLNEHIRHLLKSRAPS